MSWDYKPSSISGKYREHLVYTEQDGNNEKQILMIINNSSENQIIVQDITKKMNFNAVKMKYEPMNTWHHKEGYSTASDKNFQKFIMLIFISEVKIYDYDYPKDKI